MTTHSFDSDLACKYGLNEAVIISYSQSKIIQNQTNSGYEAFGHVWFRGSITEISEELTFLSKKKIRTSIKNLEKESVIQSMNLNKNAHDRTLWYSFLDQNFLKV